MKQVLEDTSVVCAVSDAVADADADSRTDDQLIVTNNSIGHSQHVDSCPLDEVNQLRHGVTNLQVVAMCVIHLSLIHI